MPRDSEARENWDGVRLIKLGGSRDLEGGMPSDVSKVAAILSQGDKLDRYLRGAAGGAYAALGGGLLTPIAQGVHATLLRRCIEDTQKRPRFAIVPPDGISRDPLANAEARQLAKLDHVPGCGFERLVLTLGRPISFLTALNTALGQDARG